MDQDKQQNRPNIGQKAQICAQLEIKWKELSSINKKHFRQQNDTQGRDWGRKKVHAVM